MSGLHALASLGVQSLAYPKTLSLVQGSIAVGARPKQPLAGLVPSIFFLAGQLEVMQKRMGISLILSSSGLAQALPCWNLLDLVGTFENEVSPAVIALVGH